MLIGWLFSLHNRYIRIGTNGIMTVTILYGFVIFEFNGQLPDYTRCINVFSDKGINTSTNYTEIICLPINM